MHLFAAVHKRYGVDGCYTILKEIIGVIIIFQCLILSPTVFGFRVHGVIVLEFGQTNGVVYSQIRRESDFLNTGFAFFVVIKITPLAACEP
mgnify:CR=1 FL=1